MSPCRFAITPRTQDNARIASVGGDKSVFVWDVTTGQTIKSFTGHLKRVNCVAWNADDNMVVSGSSDGTMRFWDTRQRKPTESDVENCPH